VQFGNGSTGARPPSGSENITASYRVGLGAAGNVKADQLRILLSRLLGVRGVTNPQNATGGVDPEDADDARRNVPYTALTIGRIVSLHDYEDFARAFGGVAKARADWLWDGSSGVIFVTVADVDGGEMDDASYGRLCAAIDAARDPAQHVQVESTAVRRFRIRARLLIDPHYHADEVEVKAQAALRRAFSVKLREFGQDVTECEILGLLQSIDGVVAADMMLPYPGSDQNIDWDIDKRIVAQLSRLDMWKIPPEIMPAELWVLDEGPDAVALKVVSDLSEPELT
jgi:predicted phage baseplate assembly protein